METVKIRKPRLQTQFGESPIDAENRRVQVNWYTGATVERLSWDGRYNLTLSMDPDHVRMGRFQSGRAPVLDTHSDWSTANVIGVVETAAIDGTATIRLAQTPSVDETWQKIQQGIIRNGSVGAAIHKLKDVTPKGVEMKSYLAVDWEPQEFSLVPVGADPNAGIRAAAQRELEIDVELEVELVAEDRASSPLETPTMDETTNTIGTGGEARQPDNNAVLLAERARIAELTRIAARAGIDATAAIDGGTTVEAFRAAAFDAMAARYEQNPTRSHAAVTTDSRDTLRSLIPQAILHVQGLSAEAPAREFCALASRGPMAIAEECVRATGQNPAHMSKDEIVRLAFVSTSDLPYILGATADSSLRAGYGVGPKQWSRLTARRVVSNFRLQYELNLALTATFPKVPEGGEYKVASITEGRESYRVYTYGQKLLVTRQVLINDSLGALTDVPFRLGRAAAESQDTLFWAHLVANGNLGDGNALFVAAHSNLIDAGTAINVDNLGIARKTLALQTNEDGQVMGLTPQFLVVPAAKEQLARQYMSNAFNPTAQTGINPWVGMAEIIVAPKLDTPSAISWYLFADPTVAPVIVAVYLAGNEGIFSQSETTVDVDGFKWLMRYDFGLGSVDYRGAVKNLGA